MKAKLYQTNGVVLEIEPANGKTFTLIELQGHVSGYIEHVPLYAVNATQQDMSLLCNEDGKMKGLSINEKATAIFKQYYPTTNDFIVGDALICSPEMFD